MNIYVLTSDTDGVEGFENNVFTSEREALEMYGRAVDYMFDSLELDDEDIHEHMYISYPWDKVNGRASYHIVDGQSNVWLRRL